MIGKNATKVYIPKSTCLFHKVEWFDHLIAKGSNSIVHKAFWYIFYNSSDYWKNYTSDEAQLLTDTITLNVVGGKMRFFTTLANSL